MVNWVGRKLDSLIGGAFAAVVALATSQFLAFLQQYRQRLGGHLDEIQRTIDRIVAGEAMTGLAPDARQQVAQELALRAGDLRQADAAIREAGPMSQPWAFLRHFDSDIALATLRDFQPALPLDLPSAIYGAIGLLIGWLIWEVVKLPFALMRRETGY